MPDSEVLGSSSEQVQMHTMGSSAVPGHISGENQAIELVPILQVVPFCGPEKESCAANQTLRDQTCLVPCSGLYADIQDNSLKQTMQAFKQETMTGRI